jgi:sigma-54 dependent transcriptional regulator, acetoin dehydrogenase operon transcriptional activator AcoR
VFRFGTARRVLKDRAAVSLPSSPFFATAEQRTALARERFFREGQRPTGLVGDEVMQSWKRCLAQGLLPQQAPLLEPVAKSRIKATLERSSTLREAAAVELAQLDATLAATACKTMLTDHRGVLVSASRPGLGAGALLDAAGRVGVAVGEPVLGSTAPGIVLASGQACAVTGAEHFLGGFASLHCVAAPVRDRHGRLAGVLDLSVDGGPFRFDALTLVRISAAAIENRLFWLQSRGQWLLRLHVSPTLLGTPMEGLAAVDDDGDVVALNAAARQLLQHDGQALALQALLGLRPQQAHALGAEPEALVVPGGLRLWVAAVQPLKARTEPCAVPVKTEVQASAPPPASPTSLRDTSQRLIEQTLADCGGNVARAARVLGVSRGLLYRRLKAGAH